MLPFSERCAMGLNAGISFNRDIATREYYSELNVGVDVSYAITPRTQVTAALLLKTPDALNGINRLSGAVGISHALNEDNLLLLNLGRSFSATGDDYLLIFGWSHQL